MADQGLIGNGGGGLMSTTVGPGGYVDRYPSLWQSLGTDTKRTSTASDAVPFWWMPCVHSIFLTPVQHPASMAFDGYCQGTLTVDGSTPVNRARVRLYRRSTGELVAQTWTAADGTYRFDKLMYDASTYARDYFVVFHDPAGGTTYNDVIASQFTPGA